VSLGSYIDERLLFVPGTTFADGRARDIVSKAPIDVGLAAEDKWQRMRDTVQLSDSYAKSLPKRADYVKDEESVVPQLP
jgi:hypothetical protein